MLAEDRRRKSEASTHDRSCRHCAGKLIIARHIIAGSRRDEAVSTQLRSSTRGPVQGLVLRVLLGDTPFSRFDRGNRGTQTVPRDDQESQSFKLISSRPGGKLARRSAVSASVPEITFLSSSVMRLIKAAETRSLVGRIAANHSCLRMRIAPGDGVLSIAETVLMDRMA